MKRRRQSEPCAYCGGTADTRDHVPPRLLFPTPRPSNLLTVPSCRACNGGASKDDEYFATVILIRQDLANHPVVRRLLPTVMRSLSRGPRRGLAGLLLRNSRRVPVQSPAGLHLGFAPGYVVSGERLARVLERITRGYYYHHLGVRVPLGYEVHGQPLLDADEEVRDLAARHFVGQSAHEKGEDVFHYSWTLHPDDPRTVVWRFTFYDRVEMLAIVADPLLLAAGDGDAGRTGP